ncbi:nuclear valosin-containing protein-like [Octopus vulgaris]|uniref:Nuclear valosin-containing protein-like n=1 Tax=Octopus vulgaris TaxID=6645 RepID=A0AA36FJ83_OCTVU|nr:nuclear valosin-containing protein-like [Octopus vulgaris]
MVSWKTRCTMSSKKKSLSGKESQYFMDPKLIPRVRQYLNNHSSLKSFSIGTMARELQTMYGDYARKKRIAFLKSVEKAYQIICDDDHSSDEGDDYTMQLEKKHLLKKSNYKYADDCIDIESDTTDKSFSSDNTDYVSFKDTNMMNNFMTKAYQGHSKKHVRDDKNASFMDVSPRLKTTALPQTTPLLKSSQPSPSSSLSASYLQLQNGIPSSLTVNSPLGLHQRTPQQQQISPVLPAPPPSSSSFVGSSTPLVTTTPRTTLHSMPKSFKNHHSYSAESFHHMKGQKSLSAISNSGRIPHAKSVERKKKILVRTPEERGSVEKTPVDVSATTSRPKRIRSSESKYNEPEQKPTKSDDYGFEYSTVTFADVGGNEKCLMEICTILSHMKHPEIYRQLGITPPRGILLHGPPGCGKTLLANAIAGELEVPFLKLAATELVSGVSGESEQKMRQIFEKARTNAPCILFFDEIDVITPKRETASKDMERRIVAQLLTCLDDLNDVKKSPDNVLVIGATNRPDSLDPALRRAGRFDREISLGIPDKVARQRILQVLCKSLKLSDNFSYPQLAHMTPGFVGADLNALSREAAMVAINRVFKEIQNKKKLKMDIEPTKMDPSINNSLKTNKELECSTEYGISSNPLWAIPAIPLMSEELLLALSWLREEPPLSPSELEGVFITMDDFMEAVKLVQPSAKREGFATIPDVTWDDIGALHNIREELKLAILAPVKYPERFKSLGLTRAPGILLAGPPGCGKTMLAKAISNESGINFISVKGPELLNMYVGESERAVRQVFQRARNSAPCVIFFDELDSLCPRRSESGEGGASARVVNQMLTEMDGLEERKQVFVMAATNRPDIIDPAILRPGRLDKTLYVSFPSESDRLDILRTITKDGTKPKLSDKSLLETIAKDTRCTGFSGADLSSLICEASVSAMKESIMNCPHEDSKNFPVLMVTNKHIETAFTKVKPSVSAKDRQTWLRL